MEDREYEDKTLSGEVSENGEPAAEEKEKNEHKTVLDGVPRSRVWSLVSLASGIISIVIAVFCLFWQVNTLSFLSMGFGVAAIPFSLLSRRNLGYFDGMSVAGIITGAMGLVFGLGDYLLVALF